MTALVPLTVAVPFAAAALLVLVGPWLSPRVTEPAAAAVAAAAAVLAAIVLGRAAGGGLVYWFGGWKPRGPVAVGVSFAVDGLGAALALLALGLTAAALVYSWHFFEGAHHLNEVLMLLFAGAAAGFALSGDLFNMFVFFELLSVVAFALTAYRTEEASPLQGAFSFAVTNTVGAFLVLLGIALLYGRTGALNLAQIGERLASRGRPDGLVIVAFALLVCGFLVKAAIVPFHFWLADAYAVAPAPVCLLFAGVMSDLGIYAIARVYWTAFDGALGEYDGGLRTVLLAAGAVTALVGASMAVLQRHLKRLLAYSTISDLGCFLIGIGLLSADGVAGTALFVLAHALAKGALFLVCGILLVRRESVDELVLHGRGRDLRLAAAVWFAGALALAAPPFLGTWTGHALLEDGATALGHAWVPFVLAAATVLSTGAIARAGARVFLGAGEARDPLLSPEPDERAAAREAPSVALMQVVAAALAAGGLLVGALTPLAEPAQNAAHSFVDRGAYDALVLGGRSLPPPSPEHWVTTTQSVVWGIVCLAGSLAVALGLLYRSRAVAVTLGRLVGPLRRAHSGHPGDYVAWLTLGVAIFGGVFALALR